MLVTVDTPLQRNTGWVGLKGWNRRCGPSHFGCRLAVSGETQLDAHCSPSILSGNIKIAGLPLTVDVRLQLLLSCLSEKKRSNPVLHLKYAPSLATQNSTHSVLQRQSCPYHFNVCQLGSSATPSPIRLTAPLSPHISHPASPPSPLSS